jgi:hypothetical protein
MTLQFVGICVSEYRFMKLLPPNGERKWQVGGTRVGAETRKTQSHEKG